MKYSPQYSQVLILNGGDLFPIELVDLPTNAFVVAVDGGLKWAKHLDIAVDVVIGDFDSVDPMELSEAQSRGAKLIKHPVAKDASDFELALDFALERSPSAITVIGILGNRVDH